jgi:hypothetical protein
MAPSLVIVMALLELLPSLPVVLPSLVEIAGLPARMKVKTIRGRKYCTKRKKRTIAYSMTSSHLHHYIIKPVMCASDENHS